MISEPTCSSSGRASQCAKRSRVAADGVDAREHAVRSPALASAQDDFAERLQHRPRILIEIDAVEEVSPAAPPISGSACSRVEDARAAARRSRAASRGPPTRRNRRSYRRRSHRCAPRSRRPVTSVPLSRAVDADAPFPEPGRRDDRHELLRRQRRLDVKRRFRARGTSRR